MLKFLRIHIGQDISVTKRELQIGSGKIADSDYAEMRLEDVSVRSPGYTDSDDYVARQELILHGHGLIGDSSIPQDAYEIPIVGRFSARPTENGVDIETERALYRISYN